MEMKPIFILGGGIWGSLLAYRLGELAPQLSVKIVEPGHHLGGKEMRIFYKNEIGEEAFSWLKPFITYSSGDIQVITPDQVDKVLREECSKVEVIGHRMKEEEYLREGAFVIDTRDAYSTNPCGHRKMMSLIVETFTPHQCSEPISEITTTEDGDLRQLLILPLTKVQLLIRDIRYSALPFFAENLHLNEIKSEIENRDWKVKEIIREEKNTFNLPIRSLEISQYGRILHLAHIQNELTGDCFVDAVRLIDKLAASSCRFGEMKEIISSYRLNREKMNRYYRFLNRLFYLKGYEFSRPMMLHFLSTRPSSIQTFEFGKLLLGFLSRSSFFLGKPLRDVT